MNIKTYRLKTKISTHFNSDEFKCPHCGISRISNTLINKLEELFNYVNASKCIISSGYRCRDYDIKMNGFAGKHSESIAVDCCFYDKSNNIIPSSIICCAAYELSFRGIAKINNNYTHLDIRNNGTYYGDEIRGNSSYWADPYVYFNVKREDVLNYSINNKIKYQVYTTKWLPNVISGNGDYAGILGKSFSRLYIDKLKYRVRSNGIWLPEIIGRNDFAGYSNNSPITDIAIENVSYRVHVKNGSWLPWVNGYDINNFKNGYAGNGKIIDALEIK